MGATVTDDNKIYFQLIEHGEIDDTFEKNLLEKWLDLRLIKKTGVNRYQPTHYFQPLDLVKIKNLLNPQLHNRIDLMIKFETESTNLDLQSQGITNDYAVVAAEKQMGGKGRRGKRWESPLMVNLYYSFGFRVPTDSLNNISYLSLLVGRELVALLRQKGLEAQLKWPNDIWVDKKKLAGILIETNVTSKITNVIIGIGVNNQVVHYHNLGDNHPSSLEAHLGKPMDRNILIVQITERLIALMIKLGQPELINQLKEDWKRFSAFYNQKVRLLTQEGSVFLEGVERGINDDGALVIDDLNGKQHEIYSSEYSLRPCE